MSADGQRELREAVSALMDGEATEFEVHRILAAVAKDAELRSTWQRYQTISLALRGDFAPDRTDLSARIAAAIAIEPTYGAIGSDPNPAVGKAVGVKYGSSNRKTWTAALGRVAVAASVALVAVVGMQQLQPAAPAVDRVSATSSPLAVNAQTTPSAMSISSPETATAPSQVLPGFHFPRMTARAVSLDSAPRAPQKVEMIGSQTLVGAVSQQQIQSYLNALIQNHEERASAGNAQTDQAQLSAGWVSPEFGQSLLER